MSFSTKQLWITVGYDDIVDDPLEVLHCLHSTSPLLVVSLIYSLDESLPVGFLIFRWLLGVNASR